MQTENPDDFYDMSIRNRKFGRVDAMNGPILLEKYETSALTFWGASILTTIDLPIKS
jgi:hypothetical protein